MASELEVGKLTVSDGPQLQRVSQYTAQLSCVDSGGNQTLQILGNRSAGSASSGTDILIGGQQSRTTGYVLKVEQGSDTYLTIDSTGLATFSNGINLGDTTLSNYKQGTWTPTLVRSNAAITAGVDYSDQKGNYTRVGNVVHYWFDITISILDNTTLNPSSGHFGIGGLPFTSAASTAGGYGAPSFRSMTAIASSIRNNNNSSYVQGSTTRIALKWFDASANEISIDTVTTDLTTGRLTGEGFYFTS